MTVKSSGSCSCERRLVGIYHHKRSLLIRVLEFNEILVIFVILLIRIKEAQKSVKRRYFIQIISIVS